LASGVLPDVIANETIRVTRGSDGSERLAGVMASVSYLLFIYVRLRKSPPIPPEEDFSMSSDNGGRLNIRQQIFRALSETIRGTLRLGFFKRSVDVNACA